MQFRALLIHGCTLPAAEVPHFHEATVGSHKEEVAGHRETEGRALVLREWEHLLHGALERPHMDLVLLH